MKKVELEKQASSEIAQSRERFEKEGLQLGLVLARDKDGGYKWALERIAWTIHLAAERDTRERVAKELEAMADEDRMSTEGAVRLSLAAERIRGKE